MLIEAVVKIKDIVQKTEKGHTLLFSISTPKGIEIQCTSLNKEVASSKLIRKGKRVVIKGYLSKNLFVSVKSIRKPKPFVVGFTQGFIQGLSKRRSL